MTRWRVWASRAFSYCLRGLAATARSRSEAANRARESFTGKLRSSAQRALARAESQELPTRHQRLEGEALSGERLGCALLAVHDGDALHHVEPAHPRALGRLEQRSARGGRV